MSKKKKKSTATTGRNPIQQMHIEQNRKAGAHTDKKKQRSKQQRNRAIRPRGAAHQVSNLSKAGLQARSQADKRSSLFLATKLSWPPGGFR